jgi:hypothetical protein
MPGKSQTFQIRHLSGLHVSTRKEFDRSVVLDPLLDRLKEDKRKGFFPEIIVVTGDVAFSGKMEEYQQKTSLLIPRCSACGMRIRSRDTPRHLVTKRDSCLSCAGARGTTILGSRAALLASGSTRSSGTSV